MITFSGRMSRRPFGLEVGFPELAFQGIGSLGYRLPYDICIHIPQNAGKSEQRDVNQHRNRRGRRAVNLHCVRLAINLGVRGV